MVALKQVGDKDLVLVGAVASIGKEISALFSNWLLSLILWCKAKCW